MMIHTVRNVLIICVVALGGLLLAGCIGAESNQAIAAPALTVSENTAEVSGDSGDDETLAEAPETIDQPTGAETVPQPAPGTGILATGPAGSVSEARRMDITSYDDGRSCPADCDSHVVFRNVHNGTANAFLSVWATTLLRFAAPPTARSAARASPVSSVSDRIL